MIYDDGLPSDWVLALLFAPMVKAGLREESWRRWGIVECDGARVDTAERLREQDRIGALFGRQP